MKKAIYQQKYVVAKKGIRGFLSTNVIDDLTTICDVRLKVKYSIVDALILLTGYGGITPEPVAIQLTDNYIRKTDLKINTPKISCVLKYAEGKWINDIFEGIVVDNSNQRYMVKVSCNGCIQQMILVETYDVREQRYNKGTEIEKTYIPEKEAKVIVFDNFSSKKNQEYQKETALLIAMAN